MNLSSLIADAFYVNRTPLMQRAAWLEQIDGAETLAGLPVELQDLIQSSEPVTKFRADQRRNRMGQFAPEGDGGGGNTGTTLGENKAEVADFWQTNDSPEIVKQNAVAAVTDEMESSGITQGEWNQAYMHLEMEIGHSYHLTNLEPWEGDRPVGGVQLMRHDGSGNYMEISLLETMQEFDIPFGDKTTYTVAETKEFIAKHRGKFAGTFPELPFTPEGERLVRESVVNDLVRTWASSSNDEDVVAHAMQENAKDVFKLEKTAAWKDTPDGDFQTRVDELKTFNGNFLNAYANAQYNLTQNYFAEKGITQVVVYRGLRGRVGLATGTGEVALRPMSSWSTDLSVARRFSQDSASQKGAILRTTVGVKDILSTPFTGLGCLTEQEIIIKGGVAKVEFRDLGEVASAGGEFK